MLFLLLSLAVVPGAIGPITILNAPPWPAVPSCSDLETTEPVWLADAHGNPWCTVRMGGLSACETTRSGKCRCWGAVLEVGLDGPYCGGVPLVGTEWITYPVE